jgi:GDP-4-dehydro-6-deoxy-D-mannose reductase
LVIGSALQYTPCKNEHAPHPYSLSKTTQITLAEEWRNLFSMDIIIAKPSNLIGPGPSNGVCSRIAKEIVDAERNDRSPAFHLHNRKAQCDFVDVRDAVSAYLLILQSNTKGNLFEVGSGKSRTLESVLNVYTKVANHPIQSTSDQSVECAPVQLELAPLVALGWKPEYSLESSLKEILSYHRNPY